MKRCALFPVAVGALAVSMLGCSEQGMTPCHDEIEVGITTPTHNSTMVDGFGFSALAVVQNLCGGDLLDGAIYSLTSDVDGTLAGDWIYSDGFYSHTSSENPTVGSHELTLRVVGDSGTDGDDTISFEVLENTPPTVTLQQPDEELFVAPLDTGAEIVAVVADAHEDLDSLVLSWTLDGAPLDGPTHADADGRVSFAITDADSGCQEITVTVTDMMGQSDSDAGELLLYTSDDQIDDYRWWADVDEDGWGVADTETISCEAPKGSVAFTTTEDCDDGDESVHPGAADYCDDGIDSDCDAGTPSGCFPLGDVDAAMSDAYFSGGFYDVAGVGDVDADGYDDLAFGMTDQRTHVVRGPVLGEMTSDYSWISDMPSGNLESFRGNLGYRLDGGLDVDGDGVSDMLLGNRSWAYACSGNYTLATGKLYMLLGGVLTSGTLDDYSENGAYLEGGDALVLYNDYTSGCGYTLSTVGTSVHLIPDMDGDGLADFAVSATYNESASYGAVWVMLSSDIDDLETGLLEQNYRLRLTGPENGSTLGTDIASADVDGDGLSDLLVSASPEYAPGTVYVVFGRDLPPTPSDMDIRSIASITFTGVGDSDRAGVDVAGVGDLDGDGDDEFLVAAPGARGGQGIVYLVPGFYEVNGNYGLEDEFSSSTSPNALGAVRFVGHGEDALQSVAAAGDVNNDGSMDLLIGAPGHAEEASDAGAAYLLYGGPDHWGDWWSTGTGEAREEILLFDAAMAEQSTARIYATTTWESLGSRVDAAGDMDGDGIDDILIGAGSSGGTTRVFFGGGT